MKRAAKKKRQPASRIWDAFLRIPDANTSDLAPVADEGWLASKGAYASAPIVLKLLQLEVVPLIRRLEDEQLIDLVDNSFFLVHAYGSGVPTTSDDRGAYIHLRLYFHEAHKNISHLFSNKWAMLTPVLDESDEIAGIDRKLLKNRSVGTIRELLRLQSRWVLELLEAYRDDVDPVLLLGQVRQNLHFFANMCQIKIMG
jgi:hypothetical protein